MVISHSFMLVYQRVTKWTLRQLTMRLPLLGHGAGAGDLGMEASELINWLCESEQMMPFMYIYIYILYIYLYGYMCIYTYLYIYIYMREPIPALPPYNPFSWDTNGGLSRNVQSTMFMWWLWPSGICTGQNSKKLKDSQACAVWIIQTFNVHHRIALIVLL